MKRIYKLLIAMVLDIILFLVLIPNVGLNILSVCLYFIFCILTGVLSGMDN